MSESILNELFAAPPDKQLPQDVLGELRSIMRIHSVSEQELFFKWEAYSIKMGSDGGHPIDYQTVRDFKKDLADVLEREARGKAAAAHHGHQSASKRSHAGTPRTSGVADVLNGLVSGTPSGPRSIAKRKANNLETPPTKSARTPGRHSPTSEQKPLLAPLGDSSRATPFHTRPNPGQTIESLNAHIDVPPTTTPPSEARVKLKANTELAKFNYRPMAMKLSEASEILDDRLDEFAQWVQDHHQLSDAAFGNPAAQGTAEIVAVGRIASDTVQGAKLNAASLVLETSRRMGAGLRVPLRMADGLQYDVFPGKIVALRGTNPAGEYYSVTEVLSLPLLHLPASTPPELAAHNARLSDSTALRVMIASGPYTPETDLSFDALHALLDKAAETCVDVLVLSGPFLDVQHPLIASGDFELPSDYHVPPDRATLNDAFGAFISRPLARLIERAPLITIILVPSVRDAVSKHVAWPQDRLPKRDLGLPKQVTCVTSPITLSINELVVGISSQDVLYEMQRQTVAQLGNNKASDDVMGRLAASLIQQRHFFPVFPPLAPDSLPRPASVLATGLEDAGPTAVGASLDIPYLKLGDWLQVRPDLLITPSMLTPFAKVVESVVVVNPGELSKRRAPGTFAQMTILPRTLRDGEGSNERQLVGHELYSRARVDVVRI